jgi:hypothetical protein
MGLSFTIAAEPRQRSHSQVLVPRDSWPHFTVSDSRLPQPRGTGPLIYIPQEQDSAVMPLGTGFPFRLLPRLVELRWSIQPRLHTGVISSYSLGMKHPSGAYGQIFITVRQLLTWGALPDGKTDLSFTIAAGARQRSHSRFRVPWDSRPYIAVSDSRLTFLSPLYNFGENRI